MTAAALMILTVGTCDSATRAATRASAFDPREITTRTMSFLPCLNDGASTPKAPRQTSMPSALRTAASSLTERGTRVADRRPPRPRSATSLCRQAFLSTSDSNRDLGSVGTSGAEGLAEADGGDGMAGADGSGRGDGLGRGEGVAGRDGLRREAVDDELDTFTSAVTRPFSCANRVPLKTNWADRLLGSRITYDHALRIADPLRWLASHAHHELTLAPQLIHEGSAISRRRWLYVNFLVWRKLRVVDKARRRGQDFTCRWYQLQVIEHLVEALARVEGTFAPPPHLYRSPELDFLDPTIRQLLTEDGAATQLLDDVDRFLAWGWTQLHDLQQYLTETGQVSATAVADPLATQ